MKKLVAISFVLCGVFGMAQLKSDDQLAQAHKLNKIEQRVYEVNRVQVKGTIKSSITTGFSTGNAQVVGAYFHTNVDVSLTGKENLYSKSQAIQVLKTFFSENKPSSFSIIHEGNSNNLKYYIGNLTTASGKFRITVNIKTIKGAEFISRLIIEEQ